MIEVVGIGAAGWASLGPAERAWFVADLVVGGRRQLDLLPPVTGQRREPSPGSPGGTTRLLAGHEWRRTVVLASGDPLLAGWERR